MLNYAFKLLWSLAIYALFTISSVNAETQVETVSIYSDKKENHYKSPDHQDINHNIMLPVTPLIRQDGTKVLFPKVVDDGKPVVLTFVFTSCKAVCPVMSHIMKTLQNKLGERAQKINMISISLDPEYDTPERLTQYAHQLGAGPQWGHYTGINSDIVKLEKALSIYRGDKMNHLPVFFIRMSPSDSWVRLDGFVSTESIIKQLGMEDQDTPKTH